MVQIEKQKTSLPDHHVLIYIDKDPVAYRHGSILLFIFFLKAVWKLNVICYNTCSRIEVFKDSIFDILWRQISTYDFLEKVEILFLSDYERD